MIISNKCHRMKMNWDKIETKKKLSFWTLPVRHKKNHLFISPLICKLLRLRMIWSRKRLRPSRTAWKEENKPSFKTYFRILSKISSKIKWRFNNWLNKLGKLLESIINIRGIIVSSRVVFLLLRIHLKTLLLKKN